MKILKSCPPWTVLAKINRKLLKTTKPHDFIYSITMYLHHEFRIYLEYIYIGKNSLKIPLKKNKIRVFHHKNFVYRFSAYFLLKSYHKISILSKFFCIQITPNFFNHYTPYPSQKKHSFYKSQYGIEGTLPFSQTCKIRDERGDSYLSIKIAVPQCHSNDFREHVVFLSTLYNKQQFADTTSAKGFTEPWTAS